MGRRRDFDYAPLTRRVGLGARLKALSANNLTLMGGTVGVLLIVVPLIIFIALLATGNATDVGGLVVLAMCLAAGVYVLIDTSRRSAGAGALIDFARANDLEPLGGSIMLHYAGSLFADGSHSVHQGVRTREEAFVEVGDRFPTPARRHFRHPIRPELYFRVRLAGRATPGLGDEDLVTPELHDALTRLAGVYTIEVSGDELTLFGSHGLDVATPGRVEAAFALADALAARAHAVLIPSQRPGTVGAQTESSASGTHPEPAEARTRGPLTVIGWTLALVIGGPIAIAVVMSIVDDHLRGNRLAARIVVLLVVAAALALVARVGKAAVTHRRPARRRNDPG